MASTIGPSKVGPCSWPGCRLVSGSMGVAPEVCFSCRTMLPTHARPAMSVVPDRVRLLGGPYHPPPLAIGARACCLLRGTVVITSMSSGRIPWPRCQPIGQRGGCGLLLDNTLAKAIKTESAAALMFWFGVHSGVVWHWRKLLGISRTGTEGSKRLVTAAAQKGAEVIKVKEWTPAERQAARQMNKRLNLSRNLHHGYHGPLWTAEQLALLGTLPDAEVAQRIGRTRNAVRIRRERLGIRSAGT